MIGRNSLASPSPKTALLSPADALDRFVGPERPPEETLIADARAGLTPAQMVERKLISLLKGRPLPMSHVGLSRTRRGARL